MTRISVKVRLACLVVTFLAPLSAQTGTWTSPVVLSTGGQGWEAAVAMEGRGNSVALWDERTTQDQLWSRSRLSASNWGAVTNVSPALQTTLVFPAIKISTAGFATAVWTDENGVWTADRPAGAKWEPAQLLIPLASSPIFVMNARGDAAVAWTVGSATSSSGTVMAVLRPAGGEWSAQQTVASGVHVVANHAGIGANGAAIVTWETYDAFCTPEVCTLSNFVLHASRQNAGTGAWADSGSLLGPDDNSHDARVALDSAGAAMLVAMNGEGAYTSATQGSTGGAWGAFQDIVNPQAITITSDLVSDTAGHVTLVYELIGFSSSQAIVTSGLIGNNTWSSPTVLSGSDTDVGQIYFVAAPSGAELAIWLSSTGTPQVHAVTRLTATGTWSSPVSVSGPGSSIAPEAAAVNSLGSAIVIYSGYNPASVHTEYAANYQP
jgi:hypothetical protein